MFPKLLDRYIFKAILPYAGLSLVILTTLLLIQQTTKLAEVLGSANASLPLVSGILLNLLPNVLVFALPMATLVGTATGFSRMGYDSELVSMRAGGVGTLRIVAPALLFGMFVSVLALFTGFRLAPTAAQNLRDTALRAALRRLESPVEPRTFYTGMPGKVIYVREGDQETGEWKGIFIHWQEPSGLARLVTARAGRIDASGTQTELVLDDAVVTTLPNGSFGAGESGKNVTTQHSAGLRVRDDRLSESRNALLKRIEEREPEPEELGWRDLRREASNSGTKRGLEASLAFHRRLTFCLAPLVFAFLGSVLGLRIGRRGRSYGVLLSLLAMFVYYLLALGGEQLARAQVVRPSQGAWAAPAVTLLAGILLAAFGSRIRPIRLRRSRKRMKTAAVAGSGVRGARRRLVAFLGLLDRDLLRSLISNFLLSFAGLTLIFLVFTLFELLRYVVQSRTGYYLVAQYMLFLLPYVWLILIPIGTLLAVMTTFALLVRRGEALVWWASGQSTFRLILPCVLFAAVLASAHWFLQENVMPAANRRQNALRAQIKGGISQSETSRGRFWVTNPEARQIYAFESKGGGKEVSNIIVYEFDEGDVHLGRVVTGDRGEVTEEKLRVPNPLVLTLGAGAAPGRVEREFEALGEGLRALKPELNRPSEYDTKSLSAYINELKRRGVGTESHVIALERRHADPFAPFVMVLVSAPLALFYGRRSTVAALCVAVALGLSFWGVVSALQQLGSGGLLSPKLAAWSPSFIYTVLGLYLLARAKT